ncbi:sensor histidine kinase [Conexibacter sp. DBS9H8]|uniref:sensor histidine kinase n=1 Tax=Conexibacter sp. DBS9H8 TaxID=2937801 RepID=UPI00200CC57F|nr:histidine kinase [Conexibacter sp. DBS9H8]
MQIILGVLVGLVLAAGVALLQRHLWTRAASGRRGRAIQSALHAASVMLPHLRRGLSDASAARAVLHLQTLTQAEAVALGDRERVLAFVGLGEDHHHPGDPLIPISAPAREDHLHVERQIGCPNPDCRLGPAVAAPLVIGGEVVGSVVTLYRRGREITSDDTRTVAEAAKLVSAFLELRGLEEQARALAEAELRALRAQISPHFIYNALAAIAGYIHTEPDEARELLTEFAEFIRYAFRRQAPYVTLADEFAYVETYLRLEQARFGDRLAISLRIAPDALNAVVPVLSLQPLVENAVRHGVERRGEGRIEIWAGRRDGEVRLRVSDDGVGMSPERAAQVLAGGGEGVGLANVQARLLASFGPGYGLEIESVEGEGTAVTMRLPDHVEATLVA